MDDYFDTADSSLEIEKTSVRVRVRLARARAAVDVLRAAGEERAVSDGGKEHGMGAAAGAAATTLRPLSNRQLIALCLRHGVAPFNLCSILIRKRVWWQDLARMNSKSSLLKLKLLGSRKYEYVSLSKFLSVLPSSLWKSCATAGAALNEAILAAASRNV